ncbi:MAG: hypothetical protein AUJ51_05070 [Elusimicrobia bacterium CG1_02_56_21]|nr:MAG: hypothetical protein AUJ51_05070 [Elusimicrobia bacterium CG1_02_56_21]
MSENIVRYEGSEAVPSRHGNYAAAETSWLDILAGPALAILLACFILWLIMKALRWLDKKDEFLEEGFNDVLGVKNGCVSGIPVKYEWIPVSTSRNHSHPAELDFEFTVKNPGGLRLAINKEGWLGPLSRPVGFYPPEAAIQPAWLEPLGFKLRWAPAEALPAFSDKLKSLEPLIDGNLEEIRLEGNILHINFLSEVTYELPEAKRLIDAGVKAALLFRS